MEKIGVVVGESGTNRFIISLPNSTNLMENEYVVVKVKERDTEKNVVGRVMKIGALSNLLSLSTSYEALQKIIENEIDTPKIYAQIETLGYLEDGVVKFPRNPPFPGSIVYRAPRELLEKFYRVEKMPMEVGYLLTRDDVRIHLNPLGFMRHLAVIGQTGSGKSYTTGVIIEELYKLGASVVVIDPHADYVRMNRDKDGNIVIPRFTVFRNPQSTGRYVGVSAKELTISLSDLDAHEIAEILGIPSNAKRQRAALRGAMDMLEAEVGGKITFDDLYQKIERWASGDDENLPTDVKKNDAANVLRYLRMAKRRGIANIFSDRTTPLDRIIKNKHVSIIDLSGLKGEIQDLITGVFLTKIYEINTTGEDIHPIFLIIEEAHNFIPKDKSTKSKEIIKKIAAEGRKFGVFLIIISQRPQKIDPDVLSQANSYIILRLTNAADISALKTAAESLSEDLSSLLPNLNPGEAIIVGPVVKTPAIVKIKERKSMEGGGDIDLLAKLEEAKKAVEGEIENEGATMEEIRNLLMEDYQGGG